MHSFFNLGVLSQFNHFFLSVETAIRSREIRYKLNPHFINHILCSAQARIMILRIRKQGEESLIFISVFSLGISFPKQLFFYLVGTCENHHSCFTSILAEVFHRNWPSMTEIWYWWTKGRQLILSTRTSARPLV